MAILKTDTTTDNGIVEKVKINIYEDLLTPVFCELDYSYVDVILVPDVMDVDGITIITPAVTELQVELTITDTVTSNVTVIQMSRIDVIEMKSALEKLLPLMK